MQKAKYTKEQIEFVQNLVKTGTEVTPATRQMCEHFQITFNDTVGRAFRKKMQAVTTSDEDLDNFTSTETKGYSNDKKKEVKGFTAISDDGFLLNIEDYCVHYGLDVSKIRSYKLITHSNLPFYNIVFNEDVSDPVVNEQEIKDMIEEELLKISYNPPIKALEGKVGVVKVSDFHLGSYVDNLIRTKNFSIDILASKLSAAAQEINDRNYKLVHVHILGDIIESFTGTNHRNTWKGLDKAMVGAEAIKLSVKIIHDYFLSKIVNLGEIKLVAGNHDRTSSDNKEDVQGDAANLIAWGLETLGYAIEFNPLVITHVVDGICHILTHGHHGISSRSTKQLCWDYGKQGMYNLICEGHLHSIIEKLSVAQRSKFQTIKDDAVDHRRFNCPSFFTGNFYSEALGFTSESGFVITEDNGRGVPNVFYYAV